LVFIIKQLVSLSSWSIPAADKITENSSQSLSSSGAGCGAVRGVGCEEGREASFSTRGRAGCYGTLPSAALAFVAGPDAKARGEL